MVAVASFATPQDMSDRSGGDITATIYPFLQKELDAATQAIRMACGWHIAREESQTIQRGPSRFPSTIYLPTKRLVGVTSVLINGYATDPDTVEFDPETGETNIYARQATIVMTHGYNEVPADLVLLTLELAAAGLGAGLGVDREQAGSVVVAYRSSAIEPRDAWRLAPYKLGKLP